MKIYRNPRYVVEAIQMLCEFEKPKRLWWIKVVDWILGAVVFALIMFAYYRLYVWLR